jgi:hypothetical protein
MRVPLPAIAHFETRDATGVVAPEAVLRRFIHYVSKPTISETRSGHGRAGGNRSPNSKGNFKDLRKDWRRA